ncbi:DegT/DnrJ/EryC1/StrS family aminotransferase [Zavarzinia sp. CC-PAN008]|uniref:DegT/DnrJ/EryC1/StrS family aminotransferase n=1 Tax=Zavarzinia sp. CC-PAN008 TaxID=3243332 RepID=UPI003F747D27
MDLPHMMGLALLGGTPVRSHPFAPRRTMGTAERDAAMAVLDSGVLSAFIGGPGPYFLGGPRVRAFEGAWADLFGYDHAVSVNSWTSGLMTCIGAAGIEPGDEVICTPTTMSASATSILFYGGVPVFADIEPDGFCLDPAKVEALVTPRTRAIMVAHLFGGAADLDALVAIARRHGLVLIEDAAQAPGTTLHGRLVGAWHGLGGFSLNYHKHIHTGEGGMIVTNDPVLAERCQLIRNHGENVLESHGLEDPANLIGGNYRLTELQAAIGLAQLDRLAPIVAQRQALAARLTQGLAGVPGLTPAWVRPDSQHSWYCYPIRYDEGATGVPRQRFIEAVCAELPPPASSDDVALTGGYVRPLYLNPVYQKRRALGSRGFPFDQAAGSVSYEPGLCPVAERTWRSDLMLSALIRDPLTPDDIDDLVRAIHKVSDRIAELRDTVCPTPVAA